MLEAIATGGRPPPPPAGVELKALEQVRRPLVLFYRLPSANMASVRG